MRLPRLLLSTVYCLLSTVAAAQSPAISPKEIDGYLRYLSSDLLEGRAPATRGGALATAYIESQLLSFGLEPAANGSFLQKVPIDIVGANAKTIRATASGKASATLRYPDDVVVWGGSAIDKSVAKGDLVFVGYGAVAPEYNWNDFKDVDVRGKILLVLVNDPPAPANEPKLFGGRAMTWYGRWPYKFEEAERHGAAGALIVHTTERAGYPWHTVVGSWAKEQRLLPRDPKGPAPLGVRGWITDSIATVMLKQAGLDLGALRTAAESRSFRPVATGITVDMSFDNKVEHLVSENVVGILRGADAKLKNEYLMLSAHWDHLGIGPVVNGDSIYNGAEDNASGTANLLAVAHAAARGPRPKRSMLFAFVTAEESGLLGSQWLAENPVVPNEDVVANLNMDGGNLLGLMNDLTVLGDTKSSLGPQLAGFIKPRKMVINPEAFPERGAFYRSDHFSFAKAGIPSVSIGEGEDFVGKPKGWGTKQHEEYTDKHYHQPSDGYRADFDLKGAAQLSDIFLGFARKLATDPAWPTWNRDAEFKRAPRKKVM
jgi:Zn-dependent M28 family amino/carboxypeptidase